MRALRPSLPALAFLYGIRREHIIDMPPAELDVYVDQAQRFMEIAARGGG